VSEEVLHKCALLRSVESDTIGTWCKESAADKVAILKATAISL